MTINKVLFTYLCLLFVGLPFSGIAQIIAFERTFDPEQDYNLPWHVEGRQVTEVIAHQVIHRNLPVEVFDTVNWETIEGKQFSEWTDHFLTGLNYDFADGFQGIDTEEQIEWLSQFTDRVGVSARMDSSGEMLEGDRVTFYGINSGELVPYFRVNIDTLIATARRSDPQWYHPLNHADSSHFAAALNQRRFDPDNFRVLQGDTLVYDYQSGEKDKTFYQTYYDLISLQLAEVKEAFEPGYPVDEDVAYAGNYESHYRAFTPLKTNSTYNLPFFNEHFHIGILMINAVKEGLLLPYQTSSVNEEPRTLDVKAFLDFFREEEEPDTTDPKGRMEKLLQKYKSQSSAVRPENTTITVVEHMRLLGETRIPLAEIKWIALTAKGESGNDERYLALFRFEDLMEVPAIGREQHWKHPRNQADSLSFTDALLEERYKVNALRVYDLRLYDKVCNIAYNDSYADDEFDNNAWRQTLDGSSVAINQAFYQNKSEHKFYIDRTEDFMPFYFDLKDMNGAPPTWGARETEDKKYLYWDIRACMNAGHFSNKRYDGGTALTKEILKAVNEGKVAVYNKDGKKAEERSFSEDDTEVAFSGRLWQKEEKFYRSMKKILLVGGEQEYYVKMTDWLDYLKNKADFRGHRRWYRHMSNERYFVKIAKVDDPYGRTLFDEGQWNTALPHTDLLKTIK